MGIAGLLPFLSSLHKPLHISQCGGKCVAVDTSCWLHRGAFSCAFELATGAPTTRYVNYIVKRIKLLLYHKVYPIMVFDGCNAPSKKNTNAKRRETRQQNREKGRQMLADGNKTGACEMFQKAISITFEMTQEVIKECVAMNIPVIVAPYEADAQITFLVNSGVADFAITEDSDLLPFGCQKVVFKMDDQGNGVEIDLADLGKTTEEPRFDGWNIDKFRQMCIMSGCDYIDRLPKCGLKTVHKQFRKFANVDRGIKAFISNHNMKNVSNINTKDYYQKFLEAEQAFKYHLVFDPVEQIVRPLNLPPSNLDINTLPFLGDVFDKERAVQHASGNINPQTGQRNGELFPNLHKKVKVNCRDWRENKGSNSINKLGAIPGKTKGWDSAKIKDSTPSPATLSSWTPTTKRPLMTSSPQLSKVTLAQDSGDETLVKIYGSGKRRKIIPHTTEQRSRHFKPREETPDLPEGYTMSSNQDSKPDQYAMSSSSNQDSKTSRLFFASDTKSLNPFRKEKENITPESQRPKKFISILTTPASNVITSHSSAISYDRAVSEKLKDIEFLSSSPELPRIPSPISQKPVKCGLSRRPATAPTAAPAPSPATLAPSAATAPTAATAPSPATPAPSAGSGSTNNKWLSTQSLGSLGSRSKPIKITGLLPKSTGTGAGRGKKQQTLMGFMKYPDKIKKDELEGTTSKGTTSKGTTSKGTTSKYF